MVEMAVKMMVSIGKGKCKVCGVETDHHNKITCSLVCKEKYRIAKKNRILKQTLGEEAYNETVTCAICGLRAHDLVGHIKKVYNLEIDFYKKEYNSPVRSEKYLREQSERNSGENNFVYKVKDKRTISPFSPHFYMKKGYSEQEATKMAKDKQKEVDDNRDASSYSTKIEFWLNKTGGNLEEAEKLLKERQTTFSKEICIEKYGEEKGLKKWKKRQEKWMSTLDAKSDEEKQEINHKKGLSTNFEYMSEKYGIEKTKHIFASRISTRSYSKISQELFCKIYDKIKDQYDNIYFAIKKDGIIEDKGINNEYIVETKNKGVRFLDFYIEDIECCIEFDGYFYHSDDFEEGKLENDKKREREILEMNPRMNILHIEEMKYRNFPEQEVQRCLEFIDECRRQYQS